MKYKLLASSLITLINLSTYSQTYDMWDWMCHDNWSTHHMEPGPGQDGAPKGNRKANSTTLYWVKFSNNSPSFEKHELSFLNIYLRIEGEKDGEFRYWGYQKFKFVPRIVHDGMKYWSSEDNVINQCSYNWWTDEDQTHLQTRWECEVRWKPNFIGIVDKDNNFEIVDVIELTHPWLNDGFNTKTEKFFYAKEYGCVLWEYYVNGVLTLQKFATHEVAGAFTEYLVCPPPSPCN